MFKVFINDGQTEMPDDDIFYIVAKEGIFLKKSLGIMDSIAPVKDISILQSIEKTAKMNIKKIPGGQFAQIMAFFKEVYKTFGGESVVLLFYNEEKRIYKIVPPHQKVNGVACDYNKGISIEGMTMIGTVHSHANFSAFHSGTDHSDEEHFDGLHITVGHVNSDVVTISASIIANDHRFIVNPLDYIERIEEVEITETSHSYNWVGGKAVPITGSTQLNKTKRYKMNISDKYKKVNQQWMNMVERKVYTVGQQVQSHSTYNPYTANGWGRGYESDLWKKIKTNIHPQGRVVQPHEQYNQASKISTIHDVDDIDIDSIPCLTCSNRCHKLLLENNGIDDEPDIYICEKCQSIVVEALNDYPGELPICPNCKTDEHLSMLGEEELVDQYNYDPPNVVKESSFVKCKECAQTFHLREGEYTCPFCYSPYYQDGSKENETETIMRSDSGEFLDCNMEEINQMMEHDINVERIPDPEDPNCYPLNRPKVISFKNEDDNILMRMFKGVFGGKK